MQPEHTFDPFGIFEGNELACDRFPMYVVYSFISFELFRRQSLFAALVKKQLYFIAETSSLINKISTTWRNVAFHRRITRRRSSSNLNFDHVSPQSLRLLYVYLLWSRKPVGKTSVTGRRRPVMTPSASIHSMMEPACVSHLTTTLGIYSEDSCRRE